jgi:hypothetical protein
MRALAQRARKNIVSHRAPRGRRGKSVLGLFIIEKGDDLFSVSSAASSEAGERNVFKFLPWVIFTFQLSFFIA